MFSILAEKAIDTVAEEEKLIVVEGNPIVRFCNWISLSPGSNNFVTFIILLNTILLGIQWPNMDPGLKKDLERINLGFTIFFAIEMVIKLIGLGYVLCFFFQYVQFLLLLLGSKATKFDFPPIFFDYLISKIVE